MTNLIDAILNIVDNDGMLAPINTYKTRANSMGEQLEQYIKDAFANSFNLDPSQKLAAYEKIFSYLGNQNNPPDIMLRGGDAFEIKKVQGKNNAISLNSSYPKNKLYYEDSRITASCKNCEDWREKDIFYVVGHTVQNQVKQIIFVHGVCYAADKEVYLKIYEPLSKEIKNIIETNGLQSGKTNELGRINKVDQLGITNLRVRGMWTIENPYSVFSDLFKLSQGKEFNVYAIIESTKYNNLVKTDKNRLEKNKKINITDINLKNPNNPAKLLGAKLIHYGR